MFAFRLALLFCVLSTICNRLESARILENNSSDLWRKLILTEDQESPSPQSAPLSRRITPKSIFIVPSRDPCAPGQVLDSLGRCVRVVAVDADANRIHLLNKLKQAFSMTSRPKETALQPDPLPPTTTTTTAASKRLPPPPPPPPPFETKASAASTGPLQLSIPFHRSNASEYASAPRQRPPATEVAAIAVTDADTEPTTDGGAATETTVGPEGVGSTLPPESSMGAETTTTATTAITTTTEVADAATSLPSLGDASSPLLGAPFAADALASAAFDSNRDEATTVRVYRIPGQDMQSSFRFPQQSTDERNVAAAGAFATKEAHSEATSGDRLSDRAPLPEAARPAPEVNFKGATDTKDTFDDNRAPTLEQGAASGFVAHHRGGGHVNSDSSISGSSSFAFSTSENIDSSSSSRPSSGSIISFKNDKDQKLPSGEWLRTKCNPLADSDCVGPVKNVFSPEKGVFAAAAADRSPFPPFVRFPGLVVNSQPQVRFPHGQKSPVSVDDVISLAEANGGFRHYWESNRHTNAYWPPQFVRIWPETPLRNVDDSRNYGTRSQTITFS